MTDIVIASACRTAIGKFGGALSNVPAVQLGAAVIKEAISRAGIEADAVDEVLMGCVLQSGLGQNVARQAALKAGIPNHAPATTINNVCGSGLKAVNLAAAMIQTNDADIIVVGGMENMSASPYLLNNARFGYRMNNGEAIDSMIVDGLWEAIYGYHMGVTAENVASRFGITREMQDAFAVRSQQKCEAAQKAGYFDEEIVPVMIKNKKDFIEFSKDEYPREGVTFESLEKLKPAFLSSNGTVTAANSSGINDGAAAIVLMSHAKALELGVKPLARIVSSATAGLDPDIMGMGPVYSSRLALQKAGLRIEDIDLIEANEAFAAQCVAVGQALNWDAERVNRYGGAIALGHPIGASGCRILVTLLHMMKREHKKLGLATLCVGGGMGVTTIVEAL